MRLRSNVSTRANTVACMAMFNAKFDEREVGQAEIHVVDLSHESALVLVWDDGHDTTVSDSDSEVVRLAADMLKGQ